MHRDEINAIIGVTRRTSVMPRAPKMPTFTATQQHYSLLPPLPIHETQPQINQLPVTPIHGQSYVCRQER